MGVEHIITNLVLQQSSSALLCSRLLFVGSLFRCFFLAFRVIGIIQLSWSQFLWAFLEQITWKKLSIHSTLAHVAHAARCLMQTLSRPKCPSAGFEYTRALVKFREASSNRKTAEVASMVNMADIVV